QRRRELPNQQQAHADPRALRLRPHSRGPAHPQPQACRHQPDGKDLHRHGGGGVRSVVYRSVIHVTAEGPLGEAILR
ncbi:hypothetical protein PHISP_08740, partial [Aspergillus sp. HF37]